MKIIISRSKSFDSFTGEDLAHFKQWFAGSKIMQDSKPKVFYHGTLSDISVFHASKRGDLGAGIYLTDNVAEANSYTVDPYSGSNHYTGANIVPVYVRMVNPYIWTEEDAYSDIDTRQKYIRALGHDGIIDNKRRTQHLVVFSPSQLKSAVGNSGGFDPDRLSIHV